MLAPIRWLVALVSAVISLIAGTKSEPPRAAAAAAPAVREVAHSALAETLGAMERGSVQRLREGVVVVQVPALRTLDSAKGVRGLRDQRFLRSEPSFPG